MTRSAWIMMLSSWAVITYFTVRFFLKVLNAPPKKDDSYVNE
jgi:hypothetical protein